MSTHEEHAPTHEQEHGHDHAHDGAAHSGGHAPESVPAKKKSPAAVRTLLLGAGIGIVVLALGAGGILIYGIYKLGWNNQATSVLTHKLPLPAAMVNGNAIAYSSYEDDVATVKRYFAKQQQENGAAAAEAPSDTDLRKGVLDRLVQMEVLKEEAARRNIVVSQKDIDDEYANFQKSGGGEDPSAKILDMYGWTLAQFKEKVMRPYLLQQKLAEALQKDPELNASAETKAKDILEKLKAGGDFAQMAKDNSADPGSASQGGELGWFEAGVMVPEFEQAAFALKVGQLSDLVKTQYGYHIIKLEDIQKDKKTGKVLKAKAAHILIAGPSLQEYLDGKVKDAKVTKYVKIDDSGAPAITDPAK